MNSKSKNRKSKPQKTGKASPYASKKSQRAKQLVAAGLAHHRAGRLSDAQNNYEDALAADEKHVDANHLLGALYAQQKDDSTAIHYFEKAVQGKPDFLEAWLNLAHAYRRTNQKSHAVQALRSALKIKPNELQTACLLAMVMRENGQYKEAVVVLQQAIETDEMDATLWNELGNTLKAAGALDEAVGVYQQAKVVDENLLLAPYNLGNTFFSQGRYQEAQSEYEQALAIEPNFAEAQHNLGVAYRQQEKFDLAKESLTAAISSNPNYFDAYMSLGQLFLSHGAFEDAVEHFRHATTLRPDDSQARFQLGAALERKDELVPAIEEYRKAIEHNEQFDLCYANLAGALGKIGQVNEAQQLYQIALSLNPTFLAHHYNFGHLLSSRMRYEEAVPHYQCALELDANHVDALNNLGVCYKEIGQLEEALALFHRALELEQNSAELHMNIGNTYRAQGRVDEAIRSLEAALAINPHYIEANSNLLFLLGYRDTESTETLSQKHIRWGQQLQASKKKLPLPTRTGRDVLRIGYVSPDFRNHAVSRFFEPLLRSHDKSRVHVVCYSEVKAPDQVTARLRGLADDWRQTVGMSDRVVAQQIVNDEIDVLVDLAGYTAGNRLGVFCHRPARVQATYLGYFTGTGIPEMDYWITDHVLTPEDASEPVSETIYRLPRCWLAYEPFQESLSFERREPQRSEVVFGSFNNIEKLNERVVAVWSRLLRAYSNSKLLLKSRQFRDPWVRANLFQQFASNGVSEERLIFKERDATYEEHALSFGEIDIALDPFPMQGATTTAETLWMGVPLVCLRGDRMIQRMSCSILQAIGEDQWIADTEDDYIAKAIELAENANDRHEKSRMLRAQMRGSPFCNSDDLARVLEDAYADMFSKRTQ